TCSRGTIAPDFCAQAPSHVQSQQPPARSGEKRISARPPPWPSVDTRHTGEVHCFDVRVSLSACVCVCVCVWVCVCVCVCLIFLVEVNCVSHDLIRLPALPVPQSFSLNRKQDRLRHAHTHTQTRTHTHSDTHTHTYTGTCADRT